MDAFSWGPVLGSGGTATMLYLIWAVWEHQVSKIEEHGTYEIFADILRWSLFWLWQGRWPTHDHRGVAYVEGSLEYDLAHATVHLAGGFFALLWVIESDLDLLAVFWGVPRTHAHRPCAFCPVTNLLGSSPWNNFNLSPAAPWMGAIFDVSHMLAHPEHLPNKIFQLPGVSPLTVPIDWMHTKYLGTDQYFLSSVMNVHDRECLNDRRHTGCLLYTSPSPRDGLLSRMPSSA